MSFFERILGRRENRALLMTQKDLSLVEALGGDEHFGQRVNTVRLEWLSAATAAIDAISGTIASLPAIIYRVTDAGREEDDGHPLARLVRDGANTNQSWPDFVQWLMSSTLRFGNGLAEQVPDGGGRLVELKPIQWDTVAPMMLSTGRLAYDFFDPFTLQRRRLLDHEVLHLRDRSDDGLLGRARHERCSPVIAAALALTEFAGNSYRNGAYPSGTIEVPGKLNDEGLKRLSALFTGMFTGPSKAAKALILDNGIKYQGLTATPEDMELLSARRFAIEEAARLYQVPPPIIGDLSHGTFTNSETLIRFFAQSTISTWCRKIEAEVHRSVFSDAARRTHAFTLDLSGLLRGDPEARWRSYEIALRTKVLVPNEVREAEGWNPRSGGDDVLEAVPRAPAAA